MNNGEERVTSVIGIIEMCDVNPQSTSYIRHFKQSY